MRTKTSFLALLSLTALLSFHSTSHALPILVDFEEFTAINQSTFPPGGMVPESAQLFTQLLDSYGIVFTSGSPFVTVVSYYRCVPSPTKYIWGSAPDGTATCHSDYPVTITFYKPGDASVKASTDFVSVHADLCGNGLPITLKAFDINGNLVASNTKPDSGSILQVSTVAKTV
jgi:hypothetical protein